MKHDFVNSLDWKKISDTITEQISIKSINGVTESKTYDELRYTAGYVAALRDVLRLPDQILPEDDDEKEEDKENKKDVLSLAGSSTRRALTSFRG